MDFGQQVRRFVVDRETTPLRKKSTSLCFIKKEKNKNNKKISLETAKLHRKRNSSLIEFFFFLI